MRYISSLFVSAYSFFVASFASAIDLTGTWTFNSPYSGTNYVSTNTFVQTGAALSGSGAGGSYTWPISGSVNGNSFTMTITYNELSTYSVVYNGTTDGTTMTGTWSSSWNQNGSFTASKTSSKRPSAISLICNRTADLSSATCFATVGDAGAPPRRAPTGTVRFVAREGFMGAGDTCQLQQTAYSPGVSGCSALYIPPTGFPIGAAFPVDALYEGDADFDQSATSHELIMASCVGTPQKPCSGAVAFGFADQKAIIKNILKIAMTCGGATRGNLALLPNAAEGDGGSCSIDTELDTDLLEELQSLSEAQWRLMSEAISLQDAKHDAVLKAIKNIGDQDTASLQALMQNQLELANILRKANEEYYRSKINTIKNLKAISLAGGPHFAKSKYRTTRLPLATKEIVVKNGKSRSVSLKLDKRAKKFASIFTKAGVNDLNVKLKVTYSRPGFKKPKKLIGESEVGLF